ncbi:MAG TPA: FAD-linked oxidase C-terminal domain-containing protein [Solirubrobacterales bacterium]
MGDVREARRGLVAILGEDHVLPEVTRAYTADATEGRGLSGEAALVVLPGSAAEVARVVRCCYELGLPIVPRGGGTGFAGGAVPSGDSVVISLERLRDVRALDPGEWRMWVGAGVTTADVHRLAAENGLYFPPDPGAAEQSQIGGNLATNAGGPHAFKYGVCGRWVTGLEVVVPPGDVVTVGGPLRKDVAGYDLRSLFVGSEGTLGLITAAWLRLIPMPEARLPVLATFPTTAAGCAAIREVLAAGLQPAVLEYLDGRAMEIAAAAFPSELECTGFTVIVEADGARSEAEGLRDDLIETLGGESRDVYAPTARRDIEALWRWREGVSGAVTAKAGRKISDDVSVPFDRLEEMVELTEELAGRHDIDACSWGHAGDANVHSSFLFAPGDEAGQARAEAAAAAIVSGAAERGGTVSGEHGVGITKRAYLERFGDPRALELQRAIKRAFDPANLLNPGKAIP